MDRASFLQAVCYLWSPLPICLDFSPSYRPVIRNKCVPAGATGVARPPPPLELHFVQRNRVDEGISYGHPSQVCSVTFGGHIRSLNLIFCEETMSNEEDRRFGSGCTSDMAAKLWPGFSCTFTRTDRTWEALKSFNVDVECCRSVNHVGLDLAL
jgi:hypothetical protein